MRQDDHHNHALLNARPRTLLAFAAALTCATFAFELAGGIWSRSMALLSDAGHVFMDLTALLFSLFAMGLADRPSTDERTFGLHRLEVFAALVNGVLVMLVAIWITLEALNRFRTPVTPRVWPMVALGAAGLAANLVVAWKLHRFSEGDINIRAAFLHVASDALASVAVVAGGAVIALTGWGWVDPAVGLAIAAVIFWNAGRLLRDAVHLLLEGVPPHLRLPDVIQALHSVPGVLRVDDTHVWGICSHLVSLSAHVELDPTRMHEQRAILESLQSVLRERFHITHATLQIESSEWNSIRNA